MGNILKKKYSNDSIYSDEIVKTSAFRCDNTHKFIINSYKCSYNNNIYLCNVCR
jgi:hypothetical protein